LLVILAALCERTKRRISLIPPSVRRDAAMPALRRPTQRPARHRGRLSIRRRLRTRHAGNWLLSPAPAPDHARSPSRFHPIFHWRRTADDGADLFDPASALSQIKRTGSATATVFLGGLTYVVMRSSRVGRRSTRRETSLIFVFLGYTGPGTVKSLITLRAGNAWVCTRSPTMSSRRLT
jgi:hypothetical protein